LVADGGTNLAGGAIARGEQLTAERRGIHGAQPGLVRAMPLINQYDKQEEE
jgi:hypothetical protein